jgi:hypothetical protein
MVGVGGCGMVVVNRGLEGSVSLMIGSGCGTVVNSCDFCQGRSYETRGNVVASPHLVSLRIKLQDLLSRSGFVVICSFVLVPIHSNHDEVNNPIPVNDCICRGRIL